MEYCRFETRELLASLMMSTSLWSHSWNSCHTANCAKSVHINHFAGITYVALPAVPVSHLGELVDLDHVTGDGVFSGLSSSLTSDESPPMVDASILKLFLQLKIKEGLELEGSKLVVITGHSTGGALAALTALSLLSQASPPSFRLLCITFGSPLLGNQSLSSSMSRSRLAHNFCHVVSIHDHVSMRKSNEQFWPFGTYLFCSDDGGVCLDEASSILQMFLILNETQTTPNIKEHQSWLNGHYVLSLSHQFLKSRSFGGVNLSDNSYEAGVELAVESLGFSNDDVSVKECIETATRIGRAPILRYTELAIELGNVMPSRLQIQWYKERCDASEEELGYYDSFKRYSLKRDFKVNMSRLKLALFWDKVYQMVEKNELPFDSDLVSKWVYASQFYKLLAEPLDIAYFYKHRDVGRGGHYLDEGNRPKRYEAMDKWWKEDGHPEEEKFVRRGYASATQDTCFWAKLEEAKECLDEVRREIDVKRKSSLWGKIVAFESYAYTLVKKKEVSKDVLARNSSYSVWLENLREFKFKMGGEIEMVVDESKAMET